MDTECNLNVYKTYRKPAGCLLDVLCTFNLRPVSTGMIRKTYQKIEYMVKTDKRKISKS